MTGRIMPRRERAERFVAEGRAAADAGVWTVAAAAWTEAAKLGSGEGERCLKTLAAPRLESAAAAGDVEAQAALAGILLDYFDETAWPRAFDLAARAAAAGNAAAQCTLGFIYARGCGVEPDLQSAAALWAEAIRGGDGQSAFNVAALHIRGEIPLHSEEQCLQLLTVAAQRGVVEAAAALASRLAAVDRDEEALTWILWAAERGHVGAMFAAGCWYRDGTGTDPDPVQAARWFFTMLDHGKPDGLDHATAAGLAEARRLAEAGMSGHQIREAARLAGREHDAEALLASLAAVSEG